MYVLLADLKASTIILYSVWEATGVRRTVLIRQCLDEELSRLLREERSHLADVR